MRSASKMKVMKALVQNKSAKFIYVPHIGNCGSGGGKTDMCIIDEKSACFLYRYHATSLTAGS